MKCSLVPVSISDIWDSPFCAPPNLGACWVVPSVAACWFISKYLAHLLWVRKKFAKVYIMYNPMINASAKPCQVWESLKFQLKLKTEVSLWKRRSFCTHDSCYCWCSKKSQTTTGDRKKNVNHGKKKLPTSTGSPDLWTINNSIAAHLQAAQERRWWWRILDFPRFAKSSFVTRDLFRLGKKLRKWPCDPKCPIHIYLAIWDLEKKWLLPQRRGWNRLCNHSFLFVTGFPGSLRFQSRLDILTLDCHNFVAMHRWLV